VLSGDFQKSALKERRRAADVFWKRSQPADVIPDKGASVTSHCPPGCRWITLVLALTASLAAVSLAGAAGCKNADCPDLDQLCKLGECELEQLFGQADAGPIPVGFGRGRVLVLTNTRLPRMKARLNNVVWKGKVFANDGHFTNQWLGFQASASHAEHGTSWYDGKPCVVMEYPPGTPVFANTRDELRQIGPNLYLGRFYDRCPSPKLRGFFVLQFDSPGCCDCR
jgi:hypothetical protein